MIDPNKVTEAVMEFMKNPSWKEIFTNAPGGAMERLAISFYFSKFHDQFQPEDFQEYRDLRDEYEKSLTEEDLNYLIENSDKENAKKHYQELLAKLQQSGGQPQGQMRFEKDAQGEESGQKTTEETTEKVEETVQQGEDGQEKFEEKSAETVEEKSADGNQSPAQGDEEAEKESPKGDGGDGDSDSDENQEQDEKLNTALSVALNYLQNEEKQMGNAEDNNGKKKVVAEKSVGDELVCALIGKAYAKDTLCSDNTVQDELVEALVMDADTLKDQTLQEHDRIHHKDGYHEGDTCKFRDKIKEETPEDKADELYVEGKGGPDEGTKEEYNSELTPEDKEFNRLVAEREALVRRNNEIPEENKKDSERAMNKEITWDDFFALRKERASEAEQNQKKFNKLDKSIEKMFRQAAGKAMPNTKVVGKDGLPMIVYHGTVRPRKDGFTEFADRPIFSFKQEGLASQYTHSRRDMWVSPDRTGYVIPMVMNLENPYVVDAGKRLWSNIAVDWSNEPVDTDAICKYAKEHGHDGVIIRQVRDNMFDNERSAGDEYIAFSSNQVKDCGGIYETEEGKGLSHDYEVLVSDVGNTKDDNGKVIPLSRRFDDGADIRGDVSGKTEYIEKMKSLHPDINSDELIDRLKNLGSREEMEAEIAKILGKK